MRERTHKYFGDIVSAERIDAPRVIPVKELPDDELINEILWDAFNGRGKRVAKPIIPCLISSKYYEDIVDEYIDIDEAIDEALKEAKVWE